MLTPMLSRRHVPNSFLVNNSMVKVGITSNIDRRIRDYRTTYKCHKCNARHFNVEKTWVTNLSIAELQSLEQKLKLFFEPLKGEYFSNEEKERIISWLDNELEN